jgi:hypothetical protein
MLGLVAPEDHGEEGRLLLPPTRDGHPEHGPGDPAVGVPQFGVVGEVPAKLTLASVMAHPSWMSGRAVCPARGTGDGGHRGMPRDRQGQAVEPTKSAMYQDAGRGRLRC